MAASPPSMVHLPGFWAWEIWSEAHWLEYRRRRTGQAKKENERDQKLHRHMALAWSREAWEKREAAQWPSKAGPFDAAEDHINWLKGPKWLRWLLRLRWPERFREAKALLAAVRMRRPEFLA